MNRRLLLLLVFVVITFSKNLCYQNQSGESFRFDESLSLALKTGRLQTALQQLDSLITQYPENDYLKYFYGTLLVNVGSSKVYDVIDMLGSNGDSKYSELLKLHIDIMIGESDAKERLSEKLKEYPDIGELILLDWLVKLDNDEFEKAEKTLDNIREETPLKYLPLLAIYYHSYDRDYKTALKYLDRLRNESLYRMEKDYRRLSFLQEKNVKYNFDSSFTAKYEQCGAQPGMQFITEEGIKLKMGFDTGTNGYGFSIHNKVLGDSIQGNRVYTIENGIQYNYMSKPADVTGVSVNFKAPQIDDFLIEYFEGSLSLADGVFSPLLFNAAVTINSQEKTVLIQTRESLEDYIKRLPKDAFTTVPYKVRKGWMFVPCKVNGKQVMMMLETGSRDVNFNSLATRRLNIETYESSIKWRGEDYPVTKIDTEIMVGDFTYKVSGGLESDFVLGNLGYGLAAAGDLGPDFISSYIFTIDPFNQQIILERY